MKSRFAKSLGALASCMLMLGLLAPAAYAADDDLQAPSDVEGVEAEAGDGEVTLTWDMATDNVGVTGYKIYYGLDSVTEDGGSYTFGAVETGDDDISYTVEGLENDVTYYFALTALDEAGNESEYYSEEVSATPMGDDEEDTEAPYIVEAVAGTDMVVEVTFSEEVVLPEDGASAFSIVNLESEEELDVIDAYVSSDDESVVLVTTGTQDTESSYMITAGTEITDLADNPIVSGTSDSATFDGGVAAAEDEEEEEEEDEDESEEEDTEAPEVEDVESTSLTELVVAFDEEVALPEEAPESAFEVTLGEEEDATELEVLSAVLDEEDSSKVVLETEEQSPGEDYILVVTGITDTAGNELTNVFDRTLTFQAATLDVSDLIAPEDVTNFVAALLDDSSSVELTWDASADSEGDLADQLLYTSEDDGETYGGSESLGAETTSHQVDGLTEGQSYTFKLTTVDEAGNESEGVVTSVSLPETGAGLGAVLLATVFGTHAVTRRRKNR